MTPFLRFCTHQLMCLPPSLILYRRCQRHLLIVQVPGLDQSPDDVFFIDVFIVGNLEPVGSVQGPEDAGGQPGRWWWKIHHVTVKNVSSMYSLQFCPYLFLPPKVKVYPGLWWADIVATRTYRTDPNSFILWPTENWIWCGVYHTIGAFYRKLLVCI